MQILYEIKSPDHISKVLVESKWQLRLQDGLDEFSTNSQSKDLKQLKNKFSCKNTWYRTPDFTIPITIWDIVAKFEAELQKVIYFLWKTISFKRKKSCC